MAEPMKIAVIGAGYWGKKVISEYLQLAEKVDTVDLSLVCDLAEENLKYCKDVLKIPKEKLRRTHKEALDPNHINAIHVCTPNETHYTIGKEALAAGINVLLEKPMALYAKDAWELVGLAKSSHLILQVGHIFRFNNALKMMRELIRERYLGDLYYLKLQWTTLMDSPINRDIIYDLGPHPVDIINFLLDAWPTQVTCKAEAYRRESLEEVAYMTMRYAEKLIAHVEMSWLQPGKKREVTVIGSERSATVDCLSQKIEVNENGDGERFNLDVVANNTIYDELVHFTESIRTRKNGRNGGNVGAKNVTILESLRKSIIENKTVKIQDTLDSLFDVGG